MDFDRFDAHRILLDFSEDEKKELASLCEPFEYIGEDKLCVQGETTQGLFFVQHGTLRVTQHRDVDDGMPHADQHITTLKAPTVVGELELLSQNPSVSTVTVEEPVVGLLLRHETFQTQLAQGNRPVAKMLRNVGHVLALRLVAANRRYIKLKDPDMTAANISEALSGFWHQHPELAEGPSKDNTAPQT